MASSLNPEVIQSTMEGKFHMEDLLSKDLQYSNISHQELSQAEDKPGVESSTSSKSVSDSYDKVQNDLTKPNQDDQMITAFPENILSIAENAANEISSENIPASMEDPKILSVEHSDSPTFSGKTESTDLKNLPLSHEPGSTLKIPVPPKSRDARKASDSAAGTQHVQTVSGGFVNIPNTNEILPRESMAYLLTSRNCEMDSSLFVAENPDFHFGENYMDEGKVTSFGLNSNNFDRLTLNGGCSIRDNPNSPFTECFPTLDSPLLSLAVSDATKESKLLYQDLKPPIRLLNNSNNSNESLTEILYTFENWARECLDNAFFTPVRSEDILFDFENDFQDGLRIMKQMTKRIYLLMRAANKLPDVDTILLRGLKRGMNRIRSDLISMGIKMWHTIDGIELKLFHDYMKLKLILDSASEKNTEVNYMEQSTDPKSLITDTFTLVVKRLLLLRIQMELFRVKIRLYCSEIDKLL